MTGERWDLEADLPLQICSQPPLSSSIQPLGAGDWGPEEQPVLVVLVTAPPVIRKPESSPRPPAVRLRPDGRPWTVQGPPNRHRGQLHNPVILVPLRESRDE